MLFFVRYTCINKHKEQVHGFLHLNNSIIKEVVYETDYFSQGNENFSFIQ